MLFSIKIGFLNEITILNLKDVVNVVKNGDMTIDFNLAHLPGSKYTKKFNTKQEQNDYFNYIMRKFESFDLPTKSVANYKENKV